MSSVSSLKNLELTNSFGTYSYLAGEDGTASVPSGKYVVSINVGNDNIVSGSVTIDGGASFRMEPNYEKTIDIPRGSLVGPIDIVFTGTTSYLVGLLE